MSALLNLVYVFVLIVTSPWILYRFAVTGDWSSLAMRFGFGNVPRVPGRCIWLHGSSVGEVSLLKALLAKFEAEGPDVSVLISAYTSTGLAAARQAYGAERVMPFPLDFSFLARRRLAQVDPELVVIVESELWPNFLAALAELRIPAALLNGKMSAKSYAIHARTRLIPRVLGGLNLVAVQSEEHAERFRALGVDPARVKVTGNMKYDLTSDPMPPDETDRLRSELGYGRGDIVVIGGSLHAGEDAALLAAFSTLRATQPAAALIVVPRYPSDAPKVAERVAQAGYAPVLKTSVDHAARPAPGRSGVLIVDSVGELSELYAVADIAFVGGSLFYRGANKGGHNLMEPAVRGVPVLFGPYNFSFKDTVSDLLAAEAGRLVHDASELGASLTALGEDSGLREAMGRRARDVVLSRRGATERNYQLVKRLMAGEPLQLQHRAQASTMPPAGSDPSSP